MIELVLLKFNGYDLMYLKVYESFIYNFYNAIIFQKDFITVLVYFCCLGFYLNYKFKLIYISLDLFLMNGLSEFFF